MQQQPDAHRLLTRPLLERCYRVEVTGPETVVLLGEGRHVLLRGRLYALVAPLLDGRRTCDEILRDLEGQASAAEVLHVLDLLQRKGHLVEACAEVAPEAEAFWHALGVDAGAAVERLRASSVSLAALGGASVEPLEEALASLGVRVDPEGDLAVVVTDDYLQEGLDAMNRRALDEGRPWMLLKLVGAAAWIGPVFRPGQTGCWACLAQRLRGHRAVEATLAAERGRSGLLPLPRGALPASVRAGASIAALEIARWIVRGASERLEGCVLTLDFLELSLQEHRLVRRPQCAACGEPAPREPGPPGPIEIRPRRKRFTADGGHREAPPEETLAAYERHVSPITGAVRVLHRAGRREDPWIHVYGAGPNAAMRSDDLRRLRASLRSSSGGKAKTDAQARASALCEALERVSGVFQGDEPRRRARYRDLGGSAIHPNACMGYSAAQYEARRAWNGSGASYLRVPEPFDPSAEIAWSPVWSLSRRELRYLPTSFCYYDVPGPPEHRFCFADSNGCAAGNSLEEAILQGFLELVERDGVSLWWYNRLTRPRVDLGSFGDPYLREIEALYGSVGRALWMLDLTSDLEIPVFAAVSRRIDAPGEQLLFGFGAHLDPTIAALRAVTEMNQLLAALRGRAPGDPTDAPDMDEATRFWLRTASLANQPHLDFDRAAPPKLAAGYGQAWSDDIGEDVRRCVAAAEQRGMEVLVLDQTRPDIGLPVVKVIVPGLRHFWRRLAPGRLYEVPVQMGWLPAPLEEAQMNPLTIFY